MISIIIGLITYLSTNHPYIGSNIIHATQYMAVWYHFIFILIILYTITFICCCIITNTNINTAISQTYGALILNKILIGITTGTMSSLQLLAKIIFLIILTQWLCNNINPFATSLFDIDIEHIIGILLLIITSVIKVGNADITFKTIRK